MFEAVTIGIAAMSVLVLLGVLARRAVEWSDRRESRLRDEELARQRRAVVSSGIFCHQCRHENPQQAKYCARCGTQLMKGSFTPKSYAPVPLGGLVAPGGGLAGLGALGAGPYHQTPHGTEVPKAFQDEFGGRPGLTAETDLGPPIDDPSDKETAALEAVKDFLAEQQNQK